MDVKLLLALGAAGLAVIGNVPYVRGIYTLRVEPHAYSWFVWSLVSGIAFAGQVAKGAGVGAIPTGVSWLFTLVIFFFSLRFGSKHVTRTDTIFLIIALLGLIPWALTKDPTLSVMVAVGIDLAAYVPTLRKTWHHPHTEAPILYAMNVVRHILSLFALEAYNLATVLHSAVMVGMNALMVSILAWRNTRK